VAGAVAALLTLGIHAAAEDDFSAGIAGDAAERAPAAESAAEEPAERDGPFVLVLANGDRITGTLVGLDAERLRFRPDATGDVDLAVPVTRIAALERSRSEEPVEPRGDRVYPLVGGVIHGTLTAIDGRRLELDAHLIGPLELAPDSVAAFVRHDAERPQRSAAAPLHEVHAAGGSRLMGQAAFRSTGVKVSAPGLTAEVALREVTAILFPVVEPAAVQRPTTCTLELINGSEIVGATPKFDAGRIVVDVGGGRTAAVPLDHVARAGFNDAEAGGRRHVVFWSEFADEDEELVHMVDALREGLPPGWRIVADGQSAAIEDLDAALGEDGVLVIPEMESFDTEEAPEAAALGRVLRGFLGRGGRVVIAGTDDSTREYWGETGLFSLESSDVAEGSFRFVPGHELAAGIGQSFDAVNATCAYTTTDEGLVPVAREEGGAAAVLTKKVGRGSIVLLGMDFYVRDEATDRLLVNAVARKRGR